MATRRPPAGAARGGELIPSLRAPLTACAVVLLGAAGLLAVVGADRFRSTTLLLVLLGLALLAPALAFRRAAFIGPALAFVGAAYAVSVAGRSGADQLVVAFAPLLLVGAELAYWAIESPSAVREERVVVLRRLGSVLGLAAVSAALAAFLLASSQLDVGGGLGLLAAERIYATRRTARVALLPCSSVALTFTV